MRLARFFLYAMLLGAYLALGWLPGLLLVVVAFLSTVVRLVRLSGALRPELTCPRGHRFSSFGLYRCGACGALTESWVWQCPFCGSAYGHTACPICGLAVGNPLLR